MTATRELLNRAKNMGRLGPKADGWPAVMSELHDAYIALLSERDRLEGEVAKWKRIRTPTHGNCCTCQACGLDHDSCRYAQRRLAGA